MWTTTSLLLCLTACLSAVLAQVPGGLYTVEHSEALPVARFAVKELGSQYRLVSITRRQAQIVQGTLYHLTVLVMRASMLGARLESCDVQVHDIPWLGTRELIQRHCTPRSAPGPGLRPNTGY